MTVPNPLNGWYVYRASRGASVGPQNPWVWVATFSDAVDAKIWAGELAADPVTATPRSGLNNWKVKVTHGPIRNARAVLAKRRLKRVS